MLCCIQIRSKEFLPQKWFYIIITSLKPDCIDPCWMFFLSLLIPRDAPPLLPSDTTQGYRTVKAKLGCKKVRPWKWMPFSNPARRDGAIFHHWRRVAEEGKDYPFARFNKVGSNTISSPARHEHPLWCWMEAFTLSIYISFPLLCSCLTVKTVQVPVYSEQEYQMHLHDDGWTKAETDHLFDLCKRFDLRFIVVHDRYDHQQYRVITQSLTIDWISKWMLCDNSHIAANWLLISFISKDSINYSCFQKRSVEDLKERYYNICGKLTKVRAASGTEPKIYIFDAGHERRRKEQLEKLFNRTPEQVSKLVFTLWACVFGVLQEKCGPGDTDWSRKVLYKPFCRCKYCQLKNSSIMFNKQYHYQLTVLSV